MVEQTLEQFAAIATKKVEFGVRNPLKYFILSVLAGIYVGFGIILIFSIGAPLQAFQPALLKAVMGASFGIALTLVVFAGSELFTGNNMVLTIGSLAGKVQWKDTAWLWVICLAGNFIGSMLLAWIFVASGLGRVELTAKFISTVAQAKMSAPFLELFLRGILCNMLVCLAIWTSGRTQNDAAKIMLIFWCLFAFIGSGFEHSVANMTLLGIPLFLPGAHVAELIRGLFANLIPVLLGNIIGGAIFIGAAYWFVAGGSKSVPESETTVKVAHEKVTAK